MSENVSALSLELDVDRARRWLEGIMTLKEEVMMPGVHYGSFGDTDKDALLKPGAELIALALGLNVVMSVVNSDVSYKKPDPHAHYEFRADVYAPDGTLIGCGFGSATSSETSFAFRRKGRQCPKCGHETIIKGKEEYGGGWLCWRKLGGCGATFEDDDPQITSQQSGRRPNENIHDTFNSVMKMAAKRAYVDAILRVTGASFIFTQDEEVLQQLSSSADTTTPQPDMNMNTLVEQAAGDVPWQEYINGWSGKDWTQYWLMMGKRGLKNTDVKEALGCPPKDFTGTVSEHNSLIEAHAAEMSMDSPKAQRE